MGQVYHCQSLFTSLRHKHLHLIRLLKSDASIDPFTQISNYLNAGLSLTNCYHKIRMSSQCEAQLQELARHIACGSKDSRKSALFRQVCLQQSARLVRPIRHYLGRTGVQDFFSMLRCQSCHTRLPDIAQTRSATLTQITSKG